MPAPKGDLDFGAEAEGGFFGFGDVGHDEGMEETLSCGVFLWARGFLDHRGFVGLGFQIPSALWSSGRGLCSCT